MTESTEGHVWVPSAVIGEPAQLVPTDQPTDEAVADVSAELARLRVENARLRTTVRLQEVALADWQSSFPDGGMGPVVEAMEAVTSRPVLGALWGVLARLVQLWGCERVLAAVAEIDMHGATGARFVRELASRLANEDLRTVQAEMRMALVADDLTADPAHDLDSELPTCEHGMVPAPAGPGCLRCQQPHLFDEAPVMAAGDDDPTGLPLVLGPYAQEGGRLGDAR